MLQNKQISRECEKAGRDIPISYNDYQVTKSASSTMAENEGSREREKVEPKAAALSTSRDGQMKLHTDIYIYKFCTHQSWH